MHTWFSVVITSGHIECANSEGLELEGFIKILLIPLQHSLSVDIAGMFLGVYNLESCLLLDDFFFWISNAEKLETRKDIITIHKWLKKKDSQTCPKQIS